MSLAFACKIWALAAESLGLRLEFELLEHLTPCRHLCRVLVAKLPKLLLVHILGGFRPMLLPGNRALLRLNVLVDGRGSSFPLQDYRACPLREPAQIIPMTPSAFSPKLWTPTIVQG